MGRVQELFGSYAAGEVECAPELRGADGVDVVVELEEFDEVVLWDEVGEAAD